MYPPFFDTLKDLSAVKAVFGTSPRIYPHGIADQNTAKPYCVFQIVAGNPDNFLNCTPGADNYLVQVDIYAASPASAAAGAQAIRDGIEPVAYVTSWRGQFREIDTQLYRYSFDTSWITYR